MVRPRVLQSISFHEFEVARVAINCPPIFPEKKHGRFSPSTGGNNWCSQKPEAVDDSARSWTAAGSEAPRRFASEFSTAEYTNYANTENVSRGSCSSRLMIFGNFLVSPKSGEGGSPRRCASTGRHLPLSNSTSSVHVSKKLLPLQRSADEAALAVIIFSTERFHHAAEIAEAVLLERSGNFRARGGTDE